MINLLLLRNKGLFKQADPFYVDFISWIYIVVEPSPEFPHRSLAADYPLVHPHHFHTFTLTVSSYVMVDEALGNSSNSPSYTLARYQARRPSNHYLKSCKTP
jgi:hypothetical protein